MSAVLNFVQSLQEMKKSQVKWSETDLVTRSNSLKKLADRIQTRASAWAQQLSQSEGLPVDFVLEHELLASVRTLNRISEMRAPFDLMPRPTGLISLISQSLFSFRILAERLAAALLAGNGVFIFVPNDVAQMWQSEIDPSWPVRFFDGGEDLLEILCTHPAIQGVSFYGAPETSSRVHEHVSRTWKKWQITSGFHNSALVFQDVDIERVAEKLAESCLTGLGRLHWNTTNILVLESQLENFKTEFLGALESRTFGELKEADTARALEVWSRVRSENNGKVLFGGELRGEKVQPMVVQDLTHCSTLQQDCLMAPLVLISPVKYLHEMVKWTNTSYYGMSAQIFAPDEKIEKFASQLEVSRVLANSWIESMETLPIGIKQSFSGNPDLDPYGSFFSDLRKVDRPRSK